MNKCLNALRHWRSVCFVLFCSLAATMIAVYYNNSFKFISNFKFEMRRKSYESALCNCQREVTVIVEPSNDFHWCGPESSFRGRHQKVLSFVLYGVVRADERYISLIKNISSTAEKLYPGWVVRIIYKFFAGKEVVGHQLCDAYCHFDNIDLCNMSDLIERVRISMSNTSSLTKTIDADLLVGLQPKMWRFLALLDPNVDVFLSRDLDSFIWQREVDAVGQWIRSNFTFHSMRDHPQHGVTFLGGMWGAKLDRRRDLIEGLTRAIVRYGQGQSIEGPADQTVLNEIIWPTAQYDVMVHDSYHCQNEGLNAKTFPRKVFPFPSKRDGRLFVGSVGHNSTVDTKCPEACRPAHGKDWEYC